jgi:hypothetical protein
MSLKKFTMVANPVRMEDLGRKFPLFFFREDAGAWF